MGDNVTSSRLAVLNAAESLIEGTARVDIELATFQRKVETCKKNLLEAYDTKYETEERA